MFDGMEYFPSQMIRFIVLNKKETDGKPLVIMQTSMILKLKMFIL